MAAFHAPGVRTNRFAQLSAPFTSGSRHSLRISISRLLTKAPKTQTMLDRFVFVFLLLSFSLLFFLHFLTSWLKIQISVSGVSTCCCAPRRQFRPDSRSAGKSGCVPPGQQRPSFLQDLHYVRGPGHQRPGTASHLQHGTSHKSRLPQPEFCVCYETQEGGKA